MKNSLSQCGQLKKVRYIEDSLTGKNYIAAKVLIKISATLAGLKPATLLCFCKRRDIDLTGLWERYEKEIRLNSDIETFELKRTEHNWVVLFYNRRHLTETLFNKRNMRFLKRFGYSEEMGIVEMLEHLRERYKVGCPHEIGLFLGIPLKDVLGYLEIIPLKCSYCGYWKVYGKADKEKSLFQKYRTVKDRIFDLIICGEDPIKILQNPLEYKCLFEEREHLQEVM